MTIENEWPNFLLAKSRQDEGLEVTSSGSLRTEARTPISPLLLNYWEEEFLLAKKSGLHLLTPFSEYYPAGLKQLTQAPWILYARGNLSALKIETSLLVVGARKVLPQVVTWMHEHLYSVLQESPVTVISGGAMGVDYHAHLVALRSGCPSVAYFPVGLQNPYPSLWNDFSAEFIDSGGCLVSEYSPQQQLQKHHFYRRNKLMVAQTNKVLVMQAEIRSGSAMTGRFAAELGRDLGVLPGFPWESAVSGNLQLLRCGANPIIDAQDLDLFLKF